jgi:hypothetical protein
MIKAELTAYVARDAKITNRHLPIGDRMQSQRPPRLCGET